MTRRVLVNCRRIGHWAVSCASIRRHAVKAFVCELDTQALDRLALAAHSGIQTPGCRMIDTIALKIWSREAHAEDRFVELR